jgi:hypothetical protein
MIFKPKKNHEKFDRVEGHSRMKNEKTRVVEPVYEY